jgi:excisionase family DNA binding protein
VALCQKKTVIVKRLLSTKQAGEYLGRSPWTVAEMVRTGKLPRVKDGKRIWLDIVDLDEWISSNKMINTDFGTISYDKKNS